MFKIISAIAVMGFMVNVVMSLYQAIYSNFASSIGFGLLALLFFVVLVISGFMRLSKDEF